jgi:hypothetical protein
VTVALIGERNLDNVNHLPTEETACLNSPDDLARAG